MLTPKEGTYIFMGRLSLEKMRKVVLSAHFKSFFKRSPIKIECWSKITENLKR